MINLAGKNDSNDFIKDELTRAGIDIIDVDTYGECGANYEGELTVNDQKYKFSRAWYYWIVSGLVPIDIAKKLYDHPEGRKNIRVNGCAGNQDPEKHSTFIDKNRKQQLPTNEYNEIKKFRLWDSVKDKYKVSDNKDEFDQYIDLYHIDSQAGLLYFVETLKRESKLIRDMDMFEECIRLSYKKMGTPKQHEIENDMKRVLENI